MRASILRFFKVQITNDAEGLDPFDVGHVCTGGFGRVCPVCFNLAIDTIECVVVDVDTLRGLLATGQHQAPDVVIDRLRRRAEELGQ